MPGFLRFKPYAAPGAATSAPRGALGRAAALARDPQKLRQALLRRFFEFAVARSTRVQHRVGVQFEFLGTEYGGWWVAPTLLDDRSSVWAVGVGADVSFERAILDKTQAREVRSFDPYPLFGELAARELADDARWSFHGCAITPIDGPVQMQGRQDLEKGAVSAVAGLHRGETFERPGRSLLSLMQELGTSSVELLKLDVEGLEYELLENLELGSLGVQQLGVELHHNGGVRAARRLVRRLRDAGYVPVARHAPVSYTFLRRDLADGSSQTPRAR